ncbi:MAG: hypothetical protein DBX55_09570 [Verrucomicrobia bacterium]|nr:MAG: hypothetical protein DBX55_09570 [Verrucomicrobiota bacterium]
MLNLKQDENLSKSYFIWECRRKKFPSSNPADKSVPKAFKFPQFPIISRHFPFPVSFFKRRQKTLKNSFSHSF